MVAEKKLKSNPESFLYWTWANVMYTVNSCAGSLGHGFLYNEQCKVSKTGNPATASTGICSRSTSYGIILQKIIIMRKSCKPPMTTFLTK